MVKAWKHMREGSELLRVSDDGRFVIRRLSRKSKRGVLSYSYEATDYIDSAMDTFGTLQEAKRWADNRAK